MNFLGEMRGCKKKQHRGKRDAKRVRRLWLVWSDVILQSGTYNKLTVKELDKYMDYHQLPSKYVLKGGKLEGIIHHYRASGEEGNAKSLVEVKSGMIDESEVENDGGDDNVLAGMDKTIRKKQKGIEEKNFYL